MSLEPIQEPLTVAQYAVQRICALGIKHVFGVPGDFSFPICDAFEELQDQVTWVSSANELNMAYEADGYARVNGCAVCTATYGVGELSALNGIMGSKAERLPVFILIGAPSTRLARSARPLHHSLGEAKYGRFIPLMEAATCVSAVLSPDNVIAEMERVVKTALDLRQPAYIFVPQDYAAMTVVGDPIAGVPLSEVPHRPSASVELEAAVNAIMARLGKAKRPVALPAFTIARYGLQEKLLRLLEVTGMPFATTNIDKAIISEQHPQYLGLYRGAKTAPEVLAAVQGADLVLDIGGVVFDDLSTGFATTNLQKDNLIHIDPYYVELPDSSGNVHQQGYSYSPVWIGDVLDKLIERCSSFAPNTTPRPQRTPIEGGPADLITFGGLKGRVEQFLQPRDILFTDSGTVSLSFVDMFLPEGAQYHNQTLWGSIGWATPAAFGAALADPARRVIMITGDGAHQMSANELGVMGRYEHSLIQIVVNNGLYGVEEYLEKNAGKLYNVIAPIRYAELPAAMGCNGWLCKTVTTNADLEAALAQARAYNKPCYIEVVVGEALLAALGSSMLQKAYQVRAPGPK